MLYTMFDIAIDDLNMILRKAFTDEIAHCAFTNATTNAQENSPMSGEASGTNICNNTG